MTINPDDELTDEQLKSYEARRYRQRLRESEATNAELLRTMAEVNARADAADRHAVTAELRGKFTDPNDYWEHTNLAELRGDDGSVDLAKAASHADELLTQHPHWKAAPVHGAAPGEIVNAAGLIGYGPRSVLDGDNMQPAPVRDFAQFLLDAQRAGQAPEG
jgi:hypothetical protein